MKTHAIVASICGLLVAMPGVASGNAIDSGADCDFTATQTQVGTGQAQDPGGVQLDAYTGTGSTGNPGTTAAGVCTHVGGVASFAEAGTASPRETYVVVEFGPPAGYVGVSNYDDSPTNPKSCSQSSGDAASTNGGGCLGLKPTGTTIDFNALGLGAVPTPVCGSGSHPYWNATPEDGCFLP